MIHSVLLDFELVGYKGQKSSKSKALPPIYVHNSELNYEFKLNWPLDKLEWQEKEFTELQFNQMQHSVTLNKCICQCMNVNVITYTFL